MSAELELARLEKQVLGGTRVSSFLEAVDALRRMLAREDPRTREAILRLVAPAIGGDLAAAVSSAFNLGVRDAERMIGEGKIPGVAKGPDADLITAARQAERSVAADVSTARKLARLPDVDIATALAPAFKASNSIERSVTTLVNSAGNAGAKAVADKVKLPTVWVAETNACVECLAYSGEIADPGDQFAGGLTYGAKSYNPSPIPYPPRHPNCRCTIEPLFAPEYATALKREADRSVLRGFSLESEPMKVRLDAAERLIEKGVVAPKSVIAYSKKAIRAGEFPNRGRA